MKQMLIVVKIALFIVALTALLYWREVWAWVSAKTWSELAGDILGFALKWFYLAIFAFLMNSIPHYITPWLKLLRRNGKSQLRNSRRGRGFVNTIKKNNQAKNEPPPEIKIRF